MGIISGELELELREGKEECYSNELTDFRLGGVVTGTVSS